MVSWTSARRNRSLLILVVACLLLGALSASRQALFPYVVALVLAYLLLPPVRRLQRFLELRLHMRAAARPVSILLVYVAALASVALFLLILAPIIGHQMQTLWDNRVVLWQRLLGVSRDALAWYSQNVPDVTRTQIEANLQQVGGTLVRAAQTGAARTFSAVGSTVSFVLGFAVIPFWLYYVLYDRRQALATLRRLVPDRLWADACALAALTDNVLSAYVRGQLLLSVAIGVMATVGLLALGIPYALLLGLIAGLFEFLPFIGPLLGAIPAVAVALVQQPILGLWTIILFLVIQQIENSLLAPRISGDATRLHPTVIMVVLVIGNELGGLMGMLVAAPITAILRDWTHYLYLRFQEAPHSPAAARQIVERVG
jgi:predicted PurR-regulated permease PerM